jgi:predicted anti-sigma-YlaC factor YlaD
VDCDVFQEQLDALLEKRLPDAGLDQLRLHAASCSECAMQLRLHEHLATPSLSELEAMVPEELAGSVLPRVQAEIAAHESTLQHQPGRWQGWNRLVPALAAATVLLCVGSGFLYWEVRQLRRQEDVLVRQVTEQGRRLAQLDSRTSMDPVARAASLAGRTLWERALARRNSVSVSELEQMLRSAPASTTIFSAAESEALAESLPPWMVRLAGTALSDIQSDDGIQAGELLQLIGTLDIDTERRIPTSRILAVSRQAARLGRS